MKKSFLLIIFCSILLSGCNKNEEIDVIYKESNQNSIIATNITTINKDVFKDIEIIKDVVVEDNLPQESFFNEDKYSIYAKIQIFNK
jgi:uncharacterized protein YcfL